MDRAPLINAAEAPEAIFGLRGWRIELVQLGRGPLRASSAFSPAAGLELIDLNFGPAAVLRGVSPRGSTALVFAHPASRPFRVVDGPLGRGVCLMIGSMAPIDIYMPEGSRGGLASIASSISIPIDKAPAPGATEFRSLNLEHPSLLLNLLEDTERCRPEFSFQASFSQQLVRETVQMIAQSTLLPADPGNKRMRRLAVQRASSYVDAHLSERITLADLCRAAGARSRTLEYGFLQCYDVGPMSFLRKMRLSRVRRELSRTPSSAASVAASARRWHFSHMGQFSRDYRLLFGESPSRTLARAREQALHPNPHA